MVKMYEDLASWWPLLSAPEDYAEEADIFARTLKSACDHPRTMLELGSGGGNNAFHMKTDFRLTLVDLSPEMLSVSRTLNPECEHVQGDMRTVRLDRMFDCVFVHDAIVYMTTESDLRAAIETAYIHCRPGGAALLVPDYIRENFQPGTERGGHDGKDRSLRYLEWTRDPDPNDSQYTVDYAFLLEDAEGRVQVEHDSHIEGLFARSDWLRLLSEIGFQADVLPFEHSEVDPGSCEMFLARKPS